MFEQVDGWQAASDPMTSAERLAELSIYKELRSIVAANTATPMSILEQMALDQDARVRANVASNSNTPWKTLEALAAEFPHAFLHNPIGLLQIMAQPEQISPDTDIWNAVLQV